MSTDHTTPESYPNDGLRSIDWDRSRLQLWNSFCQRYGVREDSVPLFECDESGMVLTKEIGTVRPRKILQRSAAMEALMRRETDKVVGDLAAL